MAIFKVPVSNTPQQFDIALGGKDYNVTCKWNDALDAGWVLDFADAITGLAIVANIPLITGADLLSGLEYLGINGTLFVNTDGNQRAVPTLDNLGVESFLYFETDIVDG